MKTLIFFVSLLFAGCTMDKDRIGREFNKAAMKANYFIGAKNMDSAAYYIGRMDAYYHVMYKKLPR